MPATWAPEFTRIHNFTRQASPTTSTMLNTRYLQFLGVSSLYMEVVNGGTVVKHSQVIRCLALVSPEYKLEQVRESAHTSFMKDIASRVALWQTVESGHVIQAKTVHSISMLTL